MGQTYKATGINLKAVPLGEADRVMTILTREHGLIRAVAPGARKPRSKLGGRTSLLVVNELLLAKGRSLDKITQAETLATFTGLSRNLANLTAGQYLAELVLYQALSDQPQEELFWMLMDALSQLEQSDASATPMILASTVFRVLNWSGIAPQVFDCCLSHQPLVPNRHDPDWRVGFSLALGGTVSLAALAAATALPKPRKRTERTAEASEACAAKAHPLPRPEAPPIQLTAIELALLQDLAHTQTTATWTSASFAPTGFWDAQPDSATDLARVPQPQIEFPAYPSTVWLAVERTLRLYAQYYLERPIRSANLMDACFSPAANLPNVTTANTTTTEFR